MWGHTTFDWGHTTLRPGAGDTGRGHTTFEPPAPGGPQVRQSQCEITRTPADSRPRLACPLSTVEGAAIVGTHHFSLGHFSLGDTPLLITIFDWGHTPLRLGAGTRGGDTPLSNRLHRADFRRGSLCTKLHSHPRTPVRGSPGRTPNTAG